ncbi:MAG: PAC2 family protein [Corynebacterium sp.]|nr:PAC2 family protein [Corynebacterium sp.]
MALYTLAYPQPEAIAPNVDLVISLMGFADAGHALALVNDYIASTMELIPLAEFDSDELVDYRGRRPQTRVERSFVADIDEANPTLFLCRSDQGEFLLLAGYEPDFKWKAFARAVRDLVHYYKVGRVITLYAAPFPVPHTRPQLISAHSTEPEILAAHTTIPGAITVPGAAQLYVEHFLVNTAACSVTGLNAQVPQYIAGSDYPRAAVSLLESISSITGVGPNLQALRQDADKVLEALDDLADNGELGQVVLDLENRYDQMVDELSAYRLSKDDIEAEVAKFLSELDGDD